MAGLGLEWAMLLLRFKTAISSTAEAMSGSSKQLASSCFGGKETGSLGGLVVGTQLRGMLQVCTV